MAMTATAAADQTPSLEAGAVRISLMKAQFRPDEPLTATIQNQLVTSVWATDHHTDCGLLSLEAFSGGVWSALEQCSQPRPVKVVEISAGASAPQSIGYSQNVDMGAGWPAGTYRLTLSYGLNQNQATGTGTIVVHSDVFTIG
jgi:hypothetical protein